MTIADVSGPSTAVPPNSPPTKASLANWWERFKKKGGKESNGGEKEQGTGIFGVPLSRSINYANVAISLTNADGKQFVYGYVPIVVAKCGVFLKEKATDIEGIFRLSGSVKRINDLQMIFDSPEKYGKGLDWTGYTVHDAANVLRRYLNCLPEPIIPLDFYNRFRDPLTGHPEKFHAQEAIKIYQKLIAELPHLNRQLLLYILDLLAVFASKSEVNRMTAENLAAIFQPGLLSHPSHQMAPLAYRLSQDVLVFLITHQDHFLLGMRGSNEAEGELVLSTPATPSSPRNSNALVHRSLSNSSAGADDVRKYGGLRRNASVSSKKSSGHGAKSGGMSRSNTLPSGRSPRPRHSASFRAPDGSSSPKPIEPIVTGRVPRSPSPGAQMMENMSPVSPVRGSNAEGLGLQVVDTRYRQVSGSSQQMRQVSGSSQQRRQVSGSYHLQQLSIATPPKERNFANIFSLAPGDSDRPPRKLRKKRLPGSNNHSAESSTTSLQFASNTASNNASLPSATSAGPPENQLQTVPASPPQQPTVRSQPAPISNAAAGPGFSGVTSTSTLMPTMSPTPSATSSVTSQDSNHSCSDATNTSTSAEKKKNKARRWRWSASKVDQWNPGSPTFAGSASSIAERIRRTSPSPDGKVSSEGSGDDESKSSKGGRLSWLKGRERKPSQDDKDIPIHVQVQQLPPPQYPLPGAPHVQPPTPISTVKPASTIAEAEEEPRHEEAVARPPAESSNTKNILTLRPQQPTAGTESPDSSLAPYDLAPRGTTQFSLEKESAGPMDSMIAAPPPPSPPPPQAPFKPLSRSQHLPHPTNGAGSLSKARAQKPRPPPPATTATAAATASAMR